MFSWFKKNTSYHKWVEIGSEWQGSYGNLKGINDIIEYIFECRHCEEVRRVFTKTDLSTLTARRGCYG